MNKYEVISDYKDNKKYRESFFELAKLVFEIDFSEWYNKGYWQDNYICYSYIDDGNVIANASITKMKIIIDGENFNAIQIGTVMSHENYQNQGLASNLIKHIIEFHENECDFIYLFANESVLNYYPKLGFNRINESRFYLTNFNNNNFKRRNIEKLNINNDIDKKIIEDFALHRINNSTSLDVEDNYNLLMFYFVCFFSDNLYYLIDKQVIVVIECVETTLHVYDILQKNQKNFKDIIEDIDLSGVDNIELHFMLDNNEISFELNLNNDDVLFVYKSFDFKKINFIFPLTSHA